LTDTSAIPFLLPLLYAETHYRFRYFLSLLKKKEPELLADAPHRIEPHSPIPLLILSKDAHQYPCILRQISATLSKGGVPFQTHTLLQDPVELRDEWWWRIFPLPTGGQSGWVELDVVMELEAGGKRRTYRNDNYRSSSHKPLRVFVASEPLPRFEGMYFGDCHTHSTYTNDQVEFGSPLSASVQLCKSMGHSFVCVTDHSYDLDDSVDSYLVNDPELPKWNAFQKEVEFINASSNNFTVLRGEEVSCRNCRDENVHLVVLGNRRFLPGSGDSAERWLRTRSELSIPEVLTQVEENCVTFGAHPCEPVPILQKLLLGRGQWTWDDFQHERLIGIQFANGTHEAGFRTGLTTWIRLLLSGRRIFAYGGNDAHGNFNRFRQLKIPFVTLQENNRQLFGMFRTGVFLDGPLSEESVLNALQHGRCIVTDGPALNLRLLQDTMTTRIGSTLSLSNAQSLEIAFRSTSEFGALDRIAVFRGLLEGDSEEVWYETHGLKGQMELVVSRDLPLGDSRPFYLRAEAWTNGRMAADGKPHFALSNPIWFNS
jgi:hypothetical protein